MKAVFIDRDGTLGGGEHATFPKDFILFPNVLDGIQKLKNFGYLAIAITNQPDIARGNVSRKEIEEELLSFGFDHLCICPHEYTENCQCRKPSPYMINRTVEKLQLNKSDCFVIGDRWSDMLAGISAGSNVILVKTGAGKASLNQYKDKWDVGKACYIASDVCDAIDWICSPGK